MYKDDIRVCKLLLLDFFCLHLIIGTTFCFPYYQSEDCKLNKMSRYFCSHIKGRHILDAIHFSKANKSVCNRKQYDIKSRYEKYMSVAVEIYKIFNKIFYEQIC